MDDTGNGEKVLAKADNQPMAGASKISAASEKPSTKKTSSLTPEQSLEILAKALEYCQKAGVDIRGPFPFWENGEMYLVVLLANVRLSEDRRMILA